jgi:PAS domain S-box-containing protein
MPRKDDGTPAQRDLEARIVSLEAALQDKEAVEVRLRESEERYRGLFQNLQEAFAIAEVAWADGAVDDLRLLDVNPAAARLAGVPEEDLVGRRFSDLFPGTQFVARHGDEFAAGRAAGQEELSVERLGRWLWLSYFSLGEGRVALLGSDITERKRAEERLRQSEERFRSIVENTVIGVWEMDVEGRATFVNSRTAEMFGYDPEEMLGQPAASFILEEDLASHREAMARRHAGQRETYERRFRRRDGRTIWAIVNGTPRMTPDGQFCGSFATLTEVTDRRQAEERLRAQAEMLDAAPSAITVYDERGRLLYANRRAFELHGYNEDEFMTLNLRDVDVPESAALIDGRVRRVAEEGEATFEVAHFRKDRTTVPLQIIAQQVEWAGKPALLSIATDITERKQAEQALSQQVDELRRWYAATLGRERRIAELKQEVNELAGRLGLPPPYATPESGEAPDTT